MNKQGRSVSIQTLMITVLSVFVVSMLGVQVFTQGVIFRRLDRVYEANVHLASERITKEIQETYQLMEMAVNNIAENGIVQRYAETTDSRERYTMAFNYVKPIVDMAVANLGFEQIMISDVSGSWYRFPSTNNQTLTSSLSRKVTQILAEDFSDLKETESTVLSFEEASFFCVIQPMITTNPSGAMEVRGYVVAISNMESTREMLRLQVQDENFTIALHDGKQILIASDESWDRDFITNLRRTTDTVYQEDARVMGEELRLLISIPKELIFPQKNILLFQICFGVAVMLVLVLVVSLFTNRFIVRPFTHVIRESEKMETGSTDMRISKTNVSQVDTLIAAINNMLERLSDSNREIVLTQQKIYEMELNRRDAQMYILRNQIDRHFLYNSLTSIRALADQGESQKIKTIAAGIAELLNYITSRQQKVNVFDELSIVQKYVAIQNIRTEQKIHLEIDVDDRLCQYRILKLLVQPLVENAIAHGLETKEKNAVLVLRGYLQGEDIVIEVEDNGKGIVPEALRQIQHRLKNTGSPQPEPLTGVALMNIQERITIAYGEPYGVVIESEVNNGTKAILRVPQVLDEDNASKEEASLP